MEIAVPSKYLGNYYRSHETSSINYEVSLMLSYCGNNIIATVGRKHNLHNRYQNFALLLQQLKSGLKRTIKWDKFQLKLLT